MTLKQKNFVVCIFLLLLISTMVYGFIFKNNFDMTDLISNDSVESVKVNNQKFNDSGDKISNKLDYFQQASHFNDLKLNNFSNVYISKNSESIENLSTDMNKLYFELNDNKDSNMQDYFGGIKNSCRPNH